MVKEIKGELIFSFTSFNFFTSSSGFRISPSFIIPCSSGIIRLFTAGPKDPFSNKTAFIERSEKEIPTFTGSINFGGGKYFRSEDKLILKIIPRQDFYLTELPSGIPSYSKFLSK